MSEAETPKPLAWQCQLVMNDSGGIVDSWWTMNPEDDGDDVPRGWNARVERVAAFSDDQMCAAILGERERCAKICADKIRELPGDFNAGWDLAAKCCADSIMGVVPKAEPC